MNTLRQKIREGLIVAATIGVALLVLRQSSRNPGEVSTLDRGILTVITPAQSAMSTVARGIGGFARGHAILAGSDHNLLLDAATRRAEFLRAISLQAKD